MERDDATGIARVTINNPERRNCYDPAMRHAARRRSSTSSRPTIASRSCCCAARVASSRPAPTWATRTAGTSNGDGDGDGNRERPAATEPAPTAGRRSEVVRLLPRVHGVSEGNRRRSSRLRARRRLGARARWPTSRSSRATRMIGMPATRFLGPALGSLHMFFHRLGPVLARRLLLTGDTVPASDARAPGRVHRGRRRRATCESRASVVGAEGREDAGRRHRDGQGGVPPRRTAPGVPGRRSRELPVPCVRHEPAVRGRRVQLRKARAEHGTKRAFELRDAHFEVPEPD